MSDINILVLGGSGSGKTCFMLAMYDDMRLGYGGFTFSADDVDVDQKLVWRFRRLAELKGDERWPLGTDALDSYQFNLNFALRRYMQFDWHDYRGGILRESGEPHQQVRELTEQADVVMVCAPGGLLYDAHFGHSRNAVNEMLVGEIQRLLSADSDIKPPLVILVTKFDEFAAKCRKDVGEVDEATIEKRLLAAVQQLYYSFFVPGGGWRVLVCPVSLGPQIAENRDDAAIEPQNMHLPVMYSYHEHARDLAAAWSLRVGYKSQEVEYLKGGIFNGRFRRNRREVAEADLAKLKGHHEKVQARLSVVLESLGDNLLFFENGKAVPLHGGRVA